MRKGFQQGQKLLVLEPLEHVFKLEKFVNQSVKLGFNLTSSSGIFVQLIFTFSCISFSRLVDILKVFVT